MYCRVSANTPRELLFRDSSHLPCRPGRLSVDLYCHREAFISQSTSFKYRNSSTNLVFHKFCAFLTLICADYDESSTGSVSAQTLLFSRSVLT